MHITKGQKNILGGKVNNLIKTLTKWFYLFSISKDFKAEQKNWTACLSSVQFYPINVVRHICIYVFCLNDFVLFHNFSQDFVQKSTPTGLINAYDWHLDKGSLILFERLWQRSVDAVLYIVYLFFLIRNISIGKWASKTPKP